MTHRSPGYEKYYTNACCKACGTKTSVEYAWRFGETEPVVYCASCSKYRSKTRERREREERLASEGYVAVDCLECGEFSRYIHPNCEKVRDDPKCWACRREDRVVRGFNHRY